MMEAEIAVIQFGVTAKEYRWPLDVDKSKEINSSLRAFKRYQPCLHLDFNLGEMISDF